MSVVKYLVLSCLILCTPIAYGSFLMRSNSIPKVIKNHHLRPIILVPGVVGSQLFAKLNRSTTAHIYCYRHTYDYYQVWINVIELIPEVIDCMFDDMELIYDNKTRTTRNQQGVHVKVPGEFGDTVAIDYLSTEIPRIPYFHNFIDAAYLRGYELNSTLHGAAYDWRKAPNEQQEYFQRMEATIERAYAKTGKSSVIFCHSMGCLYSLYFLNNHTQQWKDKYVRSMIAVGGPWGGAVAAVQAFAIGYNFGISLYSGSRFNNAERTFPSTAYLMPKAEVFNKNQNFVETPKKNYTVANYKQLFNDYGQPQFYEMWLDSYEMAADLVHPGVEIFCLYGTNMTTVEKLVYTDMKNYPYYPQILYGDGDGTVNSLSLKACHRWAQNKKHKFRYHEAVKGEHQSMIGDPKIVEMMLSYIATLS